MARELLYFGKLPMAVHEVDVNITMENLCSKGLMDFSHTFEDYPLNMVTKLLIILTDSCGATEVPYSLENKPPPLVDLQGIFTSFITPHPYAAKVHRQQK